MQAANALKKVTTAAQCGWEVVWWKGMHSGMKICNSSQHGSVETLTGQARMRKRSRAADEAPSKDCADSRSGGRADHAGDSRRELD